MSGTGTGGATGSGGAAGAVGTGGAAVVLPPFVTSVPNAYWNTSGTTTTVTSNADMTVTDGTAHQTWDGFGGAFNR